MVRLFKLLAVVDLKANLKEGKAKEEVKPITILAEEAILAKEGKAEEEANPIKVKVIEIIKPMAEAAIMAEAIMVGEDVATVIIKVTVDNQVIVNPFLTHACFKDVATVITTTTVQIVLLSTKNNSLAITATNLDMLRERALILILRVEEATTMVVMVMEEVAMVTEVATATEAAEAIMKVVLLTVLKLKMDLVTIFLTLKLLNPPNLLQIGTNNVMPFIIMMKM